MKALTSVGKAATGRLHDKENKSYASLNMHVPHALVHSDTANLSISIHRTGRTN